MISRAAGANGELRARLLREARACGRIAHKNVVDVYDAGETDEGNPFLVMPLLVGETLAMAIARAGRIEPAAAIRIAADIARGLSAAHAAGIVHRDLKPGNVFLVNDPDERAPVVKILDFGVSKVPGAGEAFATAAGTVIGSPAYMSPEQIRGEPIDHQTDVWSLGVVLYEMIAGARPFAGDTTFLVVSNILHTNAPALGAVVPGIDPRLSRIVSRCMAKPREDRFGSAAEVLAELYALSEGLPMRRARRSTPPSRKLARRSGSPWTALPPTRWARPRSARPRPGAGPRTQTSSSRPFVRADRRGARHQRRRDGGRRARLHGARSRALDVAGCLRCASLGPCTGGAHAFGQPSPEPLERAST